MARRVLTLIATLCLWTTGGLLLTGSAGVLFSAMFHRVGSDDWTTFTALAIALAVAGGLTIGSGLWLAVRRAGTDYVELDDDAMWLT